LAQPEFTIPIMGNSPSSGLGGSELHERRDQEGTEFKDERPPEFKELARAKTKSKEYESSNSKPLDGMVITANKRGWMDGWIITH